MARIAKYFGMVKFAHTIFALPFALIGLTLGVMSVGFDWVNAIAIVLCMVWARNAAMGFNRLVDRRFDSKNPRTSKREIPNGDISVRAARWFVGVNVALFIASTLLFRVDGQWNPWPLMLSPIAIAVVLGYSYTKRFTALCHIVLGLGLAIAPSGAYIAVTGELSVIPSLLSIVVLTWVAGFDVIYALQDADFDKGENLHSIPEAIGIKKALIVSSLLHVISTVFVVTIAVILNSALCWIGSALFLIMLLYQHLIVKENELSRIGVAFGTTNGVASITYAAFMIAGIILN